MLGETAGLSRQSPPWLAPDRVGVEVHVMFPILAGVIFLATSLASHTPPVDIDGAAEYLGTTKRHVRRLIYEKALPYYKVGRLVRLAVEDLDAYLAARRVEAEEAPRAS
jgi:excisionase family DNA binding protein